MNSYLTVGQPRHHLESQKISPHPLVLPKSRWPKAMEDSGRRWLAGLPCHEDLKIYQKCDYIISFNQAKSI